MLKQKLKIIIIIVILFISTIFVFKDFLLEVYISRYLTENFGKQFKIEKVKLLLDGIRIEYFQFNDKDFSFTLQEAFFGFNLKLFFKPIVSEISFHQAQLTAKRFSPLINIIKKILERPSQNVESLRVNLNNFIFQIKRPKIYINFSFDGIIANNSIKNVNCLEFSEFNVQQPNFILSHAYLKKYKNERYLLIIPKLIVRNREIEKLKILFQVKKNKIIFDKMQQELFGPAAYVEGFFDFSNFKNMCLSLYFNNLAFLNLVDLITGKQDVVLQGLFKGRIDICFRNFKLSALEGKFYNDEGGLINIKKEKTFDFLRTRLDKASYTALIDNFKNYAYDKGIIAMNKNNRDLSVTMNFISEKMGKRNITIIFHNIIGRR